MMSYHFVSTEKAIGSSNSVSFGFSCFFFFFFFFFFFLFCFLTIFLILNVMNETVQFLLDHCKV